MLSDTLLPIWSIDCFFWNSGGKAKNVKTPTLPFSKVSQKFVFGFWQFGHCDKIRK